MYDPNVHDCTMTELVMTMDSPQIVVDMEGSDPTATLNGEPVTPGPTGQLSSLSQLRMTPAPTPPPPKAKMTVKKLDMSMNTPNIEVKMGGDTTPQ